MRYNEFDEKLFQIFDIMKRKVPRYRRKVEAIPGDCMLPGLGLTSADKAILVKNVSVNDMTNMNNE